MKRVLTCVLAGVLSLFSGGCNGRVNNSAFMLPNVSGPTFSFNRIEEIQKYLQFNIKYVNDSKKSREGIFDYWQCAEETLELKTGDCEDIAILGSYFASEIDYPPIILSLRNTKTNAGHAVTFLQRLENHRLRYGIIDKNFYVAPACSSFRELMDAINSRGTLKWDSYELILLTPESGWKKKRQNLRDIINPSTIIQEFSDRKVFIPLGDCNSLREIDKSIQEIEDRRIRGKTSLD